MEEKKPRFKEIAVPGRKSLADKNTRAASFVIPAKLDPRAAGGAETDQQSLPPERGGYDGPEPTRFGDWEHKGRCTDF